VIIPATFNGPPGTGNGGYCCGVFSAAASGAAAGSGAGGGSGAAAGSASVAEVTLRMPPPLEVELSAVDGSVVTAAGDVIATVRPVPAFPHTGAAVGYADAVEASRSYAGFADHPFPTCYVCGPERADGLRIFPGPVESGVAAPFVAPASVGRETVWAALDCPGGWSVISPGRPYVLGRMAAVVAALPSPGDECVVVGTCGEVEGRKAAVRTALYSPDGDLLAHARATWIAVDVA
jgi:hypothetical protein